MTGNDANEFQTAQDIKTLAMSDLAHFGLNELAYVKPVTYSGQAAFAIHGADGSELAVAADHATAVAMIQQNDMQALSLH